VSRSVTAPLQALLDTGHLRVEIEGCAVLLALVDGEIHAIDDACRHRGTALSDGVLRDGVVTCPAHLWQYDVRTGRRHDTDGEPLASYPVELVGDEVEVMVPDLVRQPSLREVLLAHAQEGRS
jgi:nitrite reductase (NADH) small subunit